MSQKLAEVFDIDPLPETTIKMSREIIIPDSPSIEDVIKFALFSFKDIVDNNDSCEPRFLARNLEVAGVFLKIAQDSLVQKSQLEQKDREITTKERILASKEEDDNPPQDDREMLIENLKAKRKTTI